MHEPAPIHRTNHVGVSSEEAARILGVSLITIRRWIREGKLTAERVSRPQGYVLQVEVPAEAVLAATPTTAADEHAPRRLHVATAPAEVPATGAEPESLQAAPNESQVSNPVVFSLDESVISLVERRQRMIMELSGRVGYLQAELANARDTIRALQAPQPKDELTEIIVAGDDDLPTATTAPTARSWWQRLLWSS